MPLPLKASLPQIHKLFCSLSTFKSVFIYYRIGEDSDYLYKIALADLRSPSALSLLYRPLYVLSPYDLPLLICVFTYGLSPPTRMEASRAKILFVSLLHSQHLEQCSAQSRCCGINGWVNACSGWSSGTGSQQASMHTTGAMRKERRGNDGVNGLWVEGRGCPLSGGVR